MDILKIANFVDRYLIALGVILPGGSDGNLFTNYVDDGKEKKDDEESSEKKESQSE